MANTIKNILIMKGERNDLINLISSELLNYKNTKIYNISERVLCAPFFTSSDVRIEDHIQQMSRLHKKIEFVIFYFENLLKRAGRTTIKNEILTRQTIPVLKGLSEKLSFTDINIITQIIDTIEGIEHG